MAVNKGDNFRIDGQGERRKQLDDRCILVVGIDPDDPKKPYFLPVGPDGLKVDAEGGEGKLPKYDTITIEYYGSTNNPQYVKYRVGGAGGTVVATRTLSYAGSGAASNDRLTSSVLSIA